MGAVRLGIDLGTSNTVAVLESGDGTVRPVIFDGSELLPSAVFLGSDGEMLTGRDALHAARAAPDRFEPHPKRCIDDRTVLLGGVEVAVVDLLAAPLRRVAAEARWDPDAAAGSVTVTCPAGWAATRRSSLAAAARVAGLGRVRLVTEPVAAAAFHLGRSGTDLPVGSRMVVYDFGAGTFDASVVKRTGDGFEVLATHGLPDVGGLDIDAAAMHALGAAYAARDEVMWTRLVRPITAADRRARLAWQQEVRTAKELLSRVSSTTLFVPLFDDTAVLGRPELDDIARPVLAATVRATRAALAAAGPPADVHVMLFVGGSSRMPLAATMIHQAFGVAPTVVERPELLVAEGALAVPDAAAVPGGAVIVSVSLVKPVSLIKRARPAVADSRPEPVASVDGRVDHPIDSPGSGTRWRYLAAAVALVLAAAAAVAVPQVTGSGNRGALRPASIATPSASASAAQASPSLSPAQCLTGTWRATSQSQTLVSGFEVARGASQGGAVYTFQPDGTLVEDYSAAIPVAGTATRLGTQPATGGDITLTATTTGTATSRYTTDAWTVTINVVSGTKVEVQRRNGTVVGRYVAKPGDQWVWGFTCAGPELELCAGQLPTRITFSRTTAAPPSAPSELPTGRSCSSR